MNIFNIIKKKKLSSQLIAGQFGLEKENIRINKDGHIASTPHPLKFGSRCEHPFITTDFAEAQIELITPICQTTKEALDFMMMLHHLVSLELEDEFLWPYSQPPILPNNLEDIQIAQFEQGDATVYREYLNKKYGKYHQLLSGVHFNFSFTHEFLTTLFQETKQDQSFQNFVNDIYLKVSRFYIKHAWLMIYLTGTGHIVHNSYLDNPEHQKTEKVANDAKYCQEATSKRSGLSGYQNKPKFLVTYNSLVEYIADLEKAIHQGDIESIREFYTQLRLKTHPKSNNLNDLKNQGIHYIEIRTLDLDPTHAEGISLDTLDFLHLFLVYGLICESKELNSIEDYSKAFQNQIKVSDHGDAKEVYLEKDNSQTTLQKWGEEILNDMYIKFKSLGLNKNQINLIEKYKHKLDNKQQLIRYKITQNIKDNGYQKYFFNLSQQYYQKTQQLKYQLYGFEDLELSTQILLRESIKQGIQFNFLDRQDNFIELYNTHQHQLIKQATKTKIDHYVCVLAMENKVVTKKLLSRAGLNIASGRNYNAIDEAKKGFEHFQNHHIVIKPNSTNFGTGITILKPPFHQENFNEALEFAFLHDNQILIEQFFPGKEYRFLVMNHETVAVLHREPANVLGDGIHSIEELIEEKNRDPRRGRGYRKPLELIIPDHVTEQFLAKQHLNLKSVPPKNKKIYLRENSNISTGGDSIDFTDSIPQIYKDIAIQAANSVEAIICGVDMIITNSEISNPINNYCIIELNFNPAIQMHTYPFVGKDRKVAIKILKCLNFL